MLKEIVEQAHNWGNEFMFAKDKLEEYQSILLAPEIDDIEDDDLKYNIIHSIIENIVSDMFIDFDDNEVSELQNNIEKWFENDNVKKKLTKYQTKNIQHILDELDYLINNYDYGMIELMDIEDVDGYEDAISFLSEYETILWSIEVGINK